MDDAVPIKANVITCSDGQVLLISNKDLLAVFATMSTLEHLLLGHPGMQGTQSSRATVERTTRMITIHDNPSFYLSKHMLSQVFSCALGARDLPSRDHDDREPLIKHLEDLGGFDVLKSLLAAEKDKEKSLLAAEKDKEVETERVARRRAVSDATSPIKDVRGLFDWRAVGPQDFRAEIADSATLHAEGFQYASEQKGANAVVTYHFRRMRPT